MENDIKNKERFGGAGRPRKIAGLVLIGAGILLLSYKLGAPLPYWLFTWPMILLVIGLVISIKSNFTNPGGYIMLLIGSFFLLDKAYPGMDLNNYIVPVVLIGLGILYVFRPKNRGSNNNTNWRQRKQGEMNMGGERDTDLSIVPSANFYEENSESIEVNAILGGVKKIILSKNFRGGEVNSFMGGTELNFLKADIQHPVDLEVNNIFGGTKLLVPSNWDVRNEVTAVFGGIEDKRNIGASLPDPNKILTLRGTCVFGGIEVSNY